MAPLPAYYSCELFFAQKPENYSVRLQFMPVPSAGLLQLIVSVKEYLDLAIGVVLRF